MNVISQIGNKCVKVTSTFMANSQFYCELKLKFSHVS